jgi:hypothetical protein
MSANQSCPNDPLKLIRQLDSENIRRQLNDLDRERQALLVLLRAAQRARKEVHQQRRREGGR